LAIGIANIPEVEGEDGNIYMMISYYIFLFSIYWVYNKLFYTAVPNEKDNVYTEDDPLSLKVEGLEKPKKKRGRPRKTEVEEVEEKVKPAEVEEPEAEVDIDGKFKRRRRVPQRYF